MRWQVALLSLLTSLLENRRHNQDSCHSKNVIHFVETFDFSDLMSAYNNIKNFFASCSSLPSRSGISYSAWAPPH